MARKIVDIGTLGNDGTGDSIRDSFRKVNDNFRELYSSLGLGERLTFITLDDTPDTYIGNENAVLAVNQTTDGLKFKQITAGTGVFIDNTTNQNEIIISTEFSEISGDPAPQLGGDLSARSGGNQYRIKDLVIPVSNDEAANKEYVDTKISKAGTTAVNPETGLSDASYGTMTGPLILARDPEPDDDDVYGGLIAATKHYVDSSAFGSHVNLYVATSGQDERPGVKPDLQGRALAYAYRTLEAALKRAEELMLQSRNDIGPYRKLLTFNDGAGICILNNFDSSPLSGDGFQGYATMSVDTISIKSPGVNYNIGDVIELQGGTGTPAKYEVLSTASTPGAVVTFRQLSSGVYTDLPGSNNVTTSSNSEFGYGLEFDVTYKVNNVTVTNGGSGYSLVSVRIIGGGSLDPAFGTAFIENGEITSITVTDTGSGFTSVPTVEADLPRFLIKTENYRTDYTGDVETDTPVAYRGRDIREGLYLQGVESGALAQILAHSGELDSEGNEIFDVDIQYGQFHVGEPIAYGDVAKIDQVTVLVESGEYHENYPLKVPQNVSIVGNEFRRVIIKPKQGTSSSPWAFQKFRRDQVIDGMTLNNDEYGYHYLQDASAPVYPKVSNPGFYNAAASLIQLNKEFIQNEVVGWINNQILVENAPFTADFEYNQSLCKRDAGLIIDSMIFDLRYGSYNRTISASLKYFESASSRIAITDQLSQTTASIQYLSNLVKQVISNTEITTTYQTTYPQIIDGAFITEANASTVVDDLTLTIIDIISASGGVNYPKENEEMDVFLCNDSIRLQAISCIGHGGFMMVLDPEGQILSRSPYAQECASFSRSKDRQVFAGGMFVDGFAGNLEFKITGKDSNTRIRVSGLDRKPQLPCSFIFEGIVYRVNYIRDYVYNVEGFYYNQDKCSRDVGLIVNAVLDDLVFGTNYRSVTAGLAYLRSYSSKVTDEQKSQTISGLNKARDLVLNYLIDNTAKTAITNSMAIVNDIIDNVSPAAAPSLTWTNPVGVAAGVINSAAEMEANRAFLVEEVISYIDENLLPATIVGYDEATCARDVGYLIDAMIFDTYYGGNSATITAARAYADGNTIILGVEERTPTVQALQRLKSVIGFIIAGDLGWSKSINNGLTQSTVAGVGTESTAVENLIQIAIDVIDVGTSSIPSTTNPTLSRGADYVTHTSSRTLALNNLETVQENVIAFLNRTYADNTGSSATFILDETTPWPFPVFSYNEAVCHRDVGLIIDGLGYDLVFGTNYHARRSGLSYRQGNTHVVIDDQLSITRRAIRYAHDVAAGYVDSQFSDIIDETSDSIVTTVTRGELYAPIVSIPSPAGLDIDVSNAKDILLANLEFIRDETVGWINNQIATNGAPFTNAFEYDDTKCSRDTGYIIEALCYDLAYGGDSQLMAMAQKYIDGVGDAIVDNIAGQHDETLAAIDYVKYLAKQVIVNAPPAATFTGTPQVTSMTASTAIVQGLVEDMMAAMKTNLDGLLSGTVTQEDLWALITYPDLNAYAYDADAVTARGLLQANRIDIQDTVVSWVNDNASKYELLAPGNRSMLANDFTQINDMGYGVLATNGGLSEVVSMFTYYCYVSYHSINGAQIRSVGGSSSHGVYALIAEGADPLEVPTPTTLYYDFAQRADCYYPTASYANTPGGLFLYVYNYDYTPLNNSELEVDHGNVIYRYPVTSVSTNDLPAGVARLNLTSDDSGNFDGIFNQIPHDTVMTLRASSQVMLTGQLEDVATRPSTGLVLAEKDEVYRVLQFEADTDSKGPYEIVASIADETIIKVLDTVTEIDTDVITFDLKHGLRLNDKIIPQTSGNGLTAGTTYYVIEVPNYYSIKVSTTKGGTSVSLGNGTGLSIKCAISHNLNADFTIAFRTTDTLPAGLDAAKTYYVLSVGLTETQFKISTSRTGTPVTVTDAGVGTHTYIMEGLTKTTLRENYNYVDLTLNTPGEWVTTNGRVCSISIASPAIITDIGHGLSVGDAISFYATNNLPTGLSESRNYFVNQVLSADTFTVSQGYPGQPGTVEADTAGALSGIFYYDLIKGRAGDTQVPVVPVAPLERVRMLGTKFIFLGKEYIIQSYESETQTGKPYGRITLNRPLEDSMLAYSSAYTIKSAVPARSFGAEGTLTIRIALTRVTSHDLLEIGTGSYADTNYPKEIYGASVNAFNPDAEVEERDVGRVFYVTTDQYGNFSVGPYFKVDQGTGSVTFAASIALSNLDGIGFKRGVPIAEFSTDSGMTDNAVDTVPTENATRLYIERRLGLSHTGDVIPPERLIPPDSGGFMSLDGQLAMKGTMDMDGNTITNVADPVNLGDVVNLRSLVFANFQEYTINNLQANDLLVFTGAGNEAINASVVGDISLNIDSTANTIDAQINPDTILNADVHLPVDNTEFVGNAITQSKLNMNKAITAAAAPTGTEQQKQGTLGVASFNSAEFVATDGWLQLKDNGFNIGKIQQQPTKTVLANPSLTTGNVQAVTYASVINDGGAVKKSQYSGIGFLRRISTISYQNDSDYEVVQAGSGSSTVPEGGKLVLRNSFGDFGGRNVDVSKLKVDTIDAVETGLTSTGGYLRLYNYGGNGGIYLQNGTLATDKRTYYDNDLHHFRTENGLADAPIKASQIEVTSITTGGNTTAGTITGRWTLTGTSPNESRLQATYSADLAEYYEGDKEYDVGTVLVFGGDKEVTVTHECDDRRVAGVVSNTAAFAMYEGCPGLKNLIALQGRVPCKVVGKIEKGDMLVTSAYPGVAMVNNDPKPGTIIGKALENYDSEDVGTIEVAVGRN